MIVARSQSQQVGEEVYWGGNLGKGREWETCHWCGGGMMTLDLSSKVNLRVAITHVCYVCYDETCYSKISPVVLCDTIPLTSSLRNQFIVNMHLLQRVNVNIYSKMIEYCYYEHCYYELL